MEVGAKIKEEDIKSLLLNNLPSTYNYVNFTLNQLPSQHLDDIISSLLIEDKKLNGEYLDNVVSNHYSLKIELATRETQN